MGLKFQENGMMMDEELEWGGARVQRDGHLLEGRNSSPIVIRREWVQ